MFDVHPSRDVGPRFSAMLQGHVTAEGSGCQPITTRNLLIGWRGWPPYEASPYQFQGTTQPPPSRLLQLFTTSFFNSSSSLASVSWLQLTSPLLPLLFCGCANPPSTQLYLYLRLLLYCALLRTIGRAPIRAPAVHKQQQTPSNNSIELDQYVVARENLPQAWNRALQRKVLRGMRSGRHHRFVSLFPNPRTASCTSLTTLIPQLAVPRTQP
jgi:hypothetical protein